jgi:amino acid adenylation domain-containing protein
MTIQELLLESINRHNEEDAIITDTQRISYAKLYDKSCLVNYFLTNTFDSQIIIPLVFSSSEYYIYGIVGTLLSNNIFMPLDISHPIGKLLEYLEISKSSILLTDKKVNIEIINAFKNHNNKIIYIEDIIMNTHTNSILNFERANKDDAVYIYFTSGSTGKPKAILGKNESLLHFIKWEIKEFSVGNNDIFAQMTSPTFDPYLRDIFVPLISGAKIHLTNRNIILVPRLFGNFLKQAKITYLHTTPSILKSLMSYSFAQNHFEKLRYILIAGEVLPSELVIKWYSNYFDNTTLVNLYGPTETTLAKVFARILSDFSDDIVPVGKPIDDTKIYIINETTSSECNIGEVGEVYIETDYMTHGYYNEKEHPAFGINHNQKKWYATGDLGYIKKNELFLIGRKDEQKKIGGVRIDLNEIKKYLLEYKENKIEDCVVLYEDDKLIAFYISSMLIDIKNTRSFLETCLLSIHIPYKFIKIDHFPMTINGKLDKKKLMEDYYDKQT